MALGDLVGEASVVLGVSYREAQGAFVLDAWVRPVDDDRTPVRQQIVRVSDVRDGQFVRAESDACPLSRAADLPALLAEIRAWTFCRLTASEPDADGERTLHVEATVLAEGLTSQRLARIVQEVANVADVLETRFVGGDLR